LAELPDSPVVFRTLDLGGDKIPSFPMAHFHGNPGFGLRGLRFSLLEANLLRVQLRSIMEAATGRSDVTILFPLVTSASELGQALDAVRDVAKEAGIRSLPRFGAMIETPSAVFEVTEILELVDCAALGTNDLAQFMLASDRKSISDHKVDPFFQPGVLRAVAHVARAARAMNKPLSVCGEAAGSPASACLLVGLGIDQLSMSPNRAAGVRHVLRAQRVTDLKNLAHRALAARSREDVAAVVAASSSTG
jgi:phosphoenolpyruvate-protein kinase (PTS system EI component)